jgi:hypothetical protein
MAANLFFPGDKPPATIHGLQKAGSIFRIAPGIYTDQVADPEAVVLENWQRIVGHMLPNSVITDRSVLVGGPDQGVLFLARGAKARQIELPGLIVSVRQGAGPVKGDIEMPGGLFLASPLRGVLDNMLPSRAVRGKPARTLSDVELSNYIEAEFGECDWDRVLELLEDANRLVELLGLDGEVASDAKLLLKRNLGSNRNYPDQASSPNALTGKVKSKKPKYRKHESIDGSELGSDALKSLLDPLLSLRAAVSRLNPGKCTVDEREARWTYLPFVEAFYMSGILDGITPKSSLIKEALRSVVLAELVEQPSEFRRYFAIVSDRNEMSSSAATADEFLVQLRDRHAKLVGISSRCRPGDFKDEGEFRSIEVVGSTPTIAEQLSVGFDAMSGLGNGLGFAIGLYFLISSVRPFGEANEQMSSITLNGALSSAGESRVIYPVVAGYSEFSKFRIDGGLVDAAALIDDFVARQRQTAIWDYEDLGLVLKRLRADESF